MKHRPPLLMAILIYVTLDLSSPAIPGVFVFDAAESVESIQIRARAATGTVALPAPVRGPFLLSGVVLKDRLTPAESVEPGWRPVLSWRSRALLDPAPPSEDPH